jgi:hypothetical protein
MSEKGIKIKLLCQCYSKICLVIGLLLINVACMPGFSLTIDATQTPQVVTATVLPQPSNTPVSPSLQQPTPVPPTSEPASQGLDRVKIYLVAVGDNGVSGKLIGCGDSLVPVEVRITPTLGVLRAALDELFKLEGEQYYGQSGLYNALYQSQLSIADVAVIDGEARIFLAGTLMLGRVCDTPRVEEQLKAIALQFNTVNRVSVYVNGEPLADALDLKG